VEAACQHRTSSIHAASILTLGYKILKQQRPAVSILRFGNKTDMLWIYILPDFWLKTKLLQKYLVVKFASSVKL
jgi:hypothetical protein